ASAAGYRPSDHRIAPGEMGRRVDITLRPLPGRLIAVTVPEGTGTRWSINGEVATISPTLDRPLEAGEYALAIDNPHFLVESRRVTIKRGEEIRLEVPLDSVPGRLRIAAQPGDATVTIDGAPAGPLPLDLEKKGGAYRVAVEHPDYVAVNDIVDITNTDREVSRAYRLQRRPATLSFSATPPGGQLLVDGTRVDPAGSLAVESNLEHKVTYLKPGYFAETRSLTLRPDESQQVIFALKPEFGTVEVQSQPTATVFINGKEMGQTPLTLKLPSVPHDISVRRAGYRQVEQRVTPDSKKSTLVRATLQTELAARLNAAPNEYTNTAGIVLKLFRPTAFVSGGARHEPGQRANEFVRNIRLEKPFYAGLHEVTREQYAKFKAGPVGGAAKTPVTAVGWEDAALFCNWLSGREKLEPFYAIRDGRLISTNASADGYRLLTEAEWEWLARRAGRARQTIFPWGDEAVVPPMAGNIADEGAQGNVRVFVPGYNDGQSGVAAVGSFRPEPSGLYDLTGNVSEWVHDFYSLEPPVGNAVERDPLGPPVGDSHVVKGSNWRSATRSELRAAYRDGLMSGRDDVGFRIGRYLYGGAGDATAQ
ncbi:MAG: SUMF1/EgtB/PvdO family nonheme iron enzyme, partial [Rhodospirillales bacterium]|nr:SUMF1/EgtB/PvdO family nonheme iron enzyme [Rhodospirillales bacterium]